MTTILSPQTKFQGTQVAGGVVTPLPFGKLYTYAAGTSTPLATYTDSTGGSSNTNPVVLDANGQADVWLGSSAYKFILKDAADVTVWTVDNIDPASYSNDALLAQTIGCFAGTLAPANPVQGQFWYQPNVGLWQYTGSAWVFIIDRTTYEAEREPCGQCRFVYTNTTTCTLQRYDGRYLTIGGTRREIPAAGVTLSATGLTPSTLYYVYAYWTGTAIALEASTTGHSTDSTTGVEIKTGDATRTLVGVVYPVTGPNFADSASQRLVASWFNRRMRLVANVFSTDRATASSTPVEVNSEIQVKLLNWTGCQVNVLFGGRAWNSTTGAGALTSIYQNGSALGFTLVLSSGGTQHFGVPVVQNSTPAEGAHTFTIYGSTNGGGTANWGGNCTLLAALEI